MVGAYDVRMQTSESVQRHARTAGVLFLLTILLCIAEVGFIVRNVALVLVPAYASDLPLLPMFVATVCMTCWLLVKGIDVPKWEARLASDPAPR